VPKASVDHDGDSLPRERNVGASAKARKLVVDAEAQTTPMERRPKRTLRSSVPTLLLLHTGKSIRRRSRR
jgi:hypothetical protein